MEERPFKKDVVGEPNRVPTFDVLKNAIRDKLFDQARRCGRQSINGDFSFKVPSAIGSEFDNRPLPIESALPLGIVATAVPPVADEVAFGLGEEGFVSSVGAEILIKHLCKEGASDNFADRRRSEEQGFKMRLSDRQRSGFGVIESPDLDGFKGGPSERSAEPISERFDTAVTQRHDDAPVVKQRVEQHCANQINDDRTMLLFDPIDTVDEERLRPNRSDFD